MKFYGKEIIFVNNARLCGQIFFDCAQTHKLTRRCRMNNKFVSKAGFLLCTLLATIPAFVQGDLKLTQELVGKIDMKRVEKQFRNASKKTSNTQNDDCEIETGCLTIPKRCEIPEAEIYYKIQGKARHNKPTLVFVHGYQTTAENWACQQNSLCHCYQTIAFDMRGFGRSSKTLDIDYTMDLFADDLEAVLSELNIGKNIIIIGESMGAGVGINFAARKPDKLKKLVLMSGAPVFETTNCGTSAFCDDPEAECNATVCYPFAGPDNAGCPADYGVLDCINNAANELEAFNCIVKATRWTSLNEQCGDQQDLVIQRASQITFYGFTAFSEMCGNVPCGAIASNSALTNALRQNQFPLLSDIAVPTLIVYGTIDNNVLPQNATVLYEEIQDSFLVGFVGKGHLPHNTAVKEFNDLLIDFVKGKTCKKPFLITSECDVCNVPTVLPFQPCAAAG